MPKPAPSTYSKEQRWRFVHRFVGDKELIEFANNIIKCDGRKIDEVLPELLAFLKKGKTENKKIWLDLWVNILHQTGLGYTGGQGKFLYATALCDFLCQTKNLKAYYLYWGLKFQFPFSYPKHQHYIEEKVAVQPVVLILQYLVQLYDLKKDFSATFLTKEEITKFLMRSKGHDEILENSKEILLLREKNYDYAQEEKQDPGFREAGDDFFSRGKLFIENVEIVKFSHNKIIIENESHLEKIRKFLRFRKDPLVFTENSPDMRNQLFSRIYNHLDPDPQALLEETIIEWKSKRKEAIDLSSRSQEKQVFNPEDIRGSFTLKYVNTRKFQAKLKKDLLILYKGRCCICDLNIPSFLRAAHIVPVEIDPSIAADLSNCLLLCVLHDVAFECGLIYLNDECEIQINTTHLYKMRHPLLERELLKRRNQKINLPEKLRPNIEYLKRHRLLKQT